MYKANENRYEKMIYNRCGNSGLKLPAVSLGLWHNFGDKDSYANMEEMCFTAFDKGITHFDLANNYGPTLEKATAILNELHTPFIINQNSYNILNRTIEKNGLKSTAAKLGKGIRLLQKWHLPGF